MDVKEALKKSSSFLKNCFCDMVDLHCEEKIALAVEKQKKEDACLAIAAFLELKTPEDEIMHLLSKFYDVDSIAEADKMITMVKVKKQVYALCDYLKELGMSSIEVANYLEEHRVEIQIKTDSKLQNMAIGKLKTYFDKHG